MLIAFASSYTIIKQHETGVGNWGHEPSKFYLLVCNWDHVYNPVCSWGPRNTPSDRETDHKLFTAFLISKFKELFRIIIVKYVNNIGQIFYNVYV